MSSIYDLVKVSKNPVEKAYVSKKDSIVSGLKENIRLLKERGNIDLAPIKDKKGNVISPSGNADAVLTERNQWWSKPNKKDGIVRIRIECKGKKVYFDKENAEKSTLFEGGKTHKDVLNTFEVLLAWVEKNMNEDTELFYRSRRTVTVMKDGVAVSVKKGDRYIATM